MKSIYTNGASARDYDEGYLDDEHIETMLYMYKEEHTKPRIAYHGFILYEEHSTYGEYMVGLYVVRGITSGNLRVRCILYHEDDEDKRQWKRPFKHITCFVPDCD